MTGFQNNIGGGMITGYLFTNSMQSVRGNKAAKTQNKGPDMKLKRIINKFKAGRKLSSGEMAYLAERSPETYQKVLRITQERERLEERLEQAATKEEVAKIMAEEMNNIDKLSNQDEFETTARVNQYSDAYAEHVKSQEYKDKPDTDIELAEEKNRRMKDRTGLDDEEERRKKRRRRKRRAEREKERENSLWDVMQRKNTSFGTFNPSEKNRREKGAGAGGKNERQDGAGFDMLAGDVCYGTYGADGLEYGEYSYDGADAGIGADNTGDTGVALPSDSRTGGGTAGGRHGDAAPKTGSRSGRPASGSGKKINVGV